MDDEERKRYELRRIVEELKKYQGYGTNLVSVYIPPDVDMADILNQLRQEYAISQNIKSKQVRKGVMAALDSLINRLKHFKRSPKNGLVAFAGEVMEAPGKTKFVVYVIEPPLPLNYSLYHCDTKFKVEPLEEALKERDVYGLLLIDRREATMGFLRGKHIEPVSHFDSLVPGKHHKGGQSSRRFERLIELAAHEFFKKVGDEASKIFMSEPNLKGIFIGGPGPTKQEFVNKGYLHVNLRDKVLGVFDTGYTDESGLRELVEKASEALQDLKIAQEKRLIQDLMKTILKPNSADLVVYGIKNVIEALKVGAVDKLLISEGLNKDIILYECPSCGHQEYEIVEREREVGIKRCPECGVDMKSERKDLVKYLLELADEMGTETVLISDKSEEGVMFLRTFGGVAGYLRFNYRRVQR